MLRLEVREAAVNHVVLDVDLQGSAGARIYRSRQASRPGEEVGVTRTPCGLPNHRPRPTPQKERTSTGWTSSFAGNGPGEAAQRWTITTCR